MNSVRVQHYPGCTADYPEKPEGEAAQRIMEIDIEDGEKVLQCVDCGAFVVVKRRESAFACLRNAETVVSGDARARQPGGAWLAGMAAG
jgi:predicted RNA-binding Zn-ribbon protein involved in translation (DUF1610 family)